MAGRDSRDRSWHWSFRCSRAHFCGIMCSTGIVAAAVAPPDEPAALAGIRAITSPFVDGIDAQAQIKTLTSNFVVGLPGIGPAAKGSVTCGNAQSDDARQRETT